MSEHHVHLFEFHCVFQLLRNCLICWIFCKCDKSIDDRGFGNTRIKVMYLIVKRPGLMLNQLSPGPFDEIFASGTRLNIRSEDYYLLVSINRSSLNLLLFNFECLDKLHQGHILELRSIKTSIVRSLILMKSITIKVHEVLINYGLISVDLILIFENIVLNLIAV